MKVTKTDIEMIQRYCHIKNIKCEEYHKYTIVINSHSLSKKFYSLYDMSSSSHEIEFLSRVEQYFINKGKRQDKKWNK